MKEYEMIDQSLQLSLSLEAFKDLILTLLYQRAFSFYSETVK